jgi:Restriction endonuclease
MARHNDKGKLVEALAAWLHDWPEARVERNAHLLAIHGRRRRKREIDVLIHASVTGYPVRIAIECKNETEKIGAPMIDAFIGKLRDIGIPSQCGVVVSASGYTTGALDRAQIDGVRTLTLRGLSSDGLKASITETAYQSIVLLVPIVGEVSFASNSTEPGPPLFVDANGQFCGTIPHLLAAAWRKEDIPHQLGIHHVALDVPKGWSVVHSSGASGTLIVPVIYATVMVNARAFKVEGVAERYSLVDETTSSTEKMGVKTSFPELKDRCVLTPLESEDALRAFLDTRGAVQLVQRIPVPRILYFSAFWPLSRHTAERLGTNARHHDGTPTGPRPGPPDLVEDLIDLTSAWDESMSLQEFDEIVLGGLSQRVAARRATPPSQ